MIFRLGKRTYIGIILHALLVLCGVQLLLMLISCFGIKIMHVAYDTLPVKILAAAVFICWLFFYIRCAGSFLKLYFCEIELYEDKLLVKTGEGPAEYLFTEETMFDGLQVKGLLSGGKKCSLALNFLHTGPQNLEKLVSLFDRRTNRPPFQF